MKIIHIKVIALFLVLIIPFNIAAQDKLKGNKIVIIEDRNIYDFEKIVIKDKIEVIISQGRDKSVTVETDENLQFAVLTEVNNNVLTIRLSNKISKSKVLKVSVIVDEFLDEINTKDKANVAAKGNLNLDQITINAEGDSKINMDIKCSNFTLHNNESANLNLTVNTTKAIINANKTGKAKINIQAENIEVLGLGNSTTELSGYSTELLVNSENKSNLKAATLECDEVTVNASDTSDVQINSNNSVIISAINSAEIHIYNNPKITIEKFTDKAILRKK